MRGRLALLAAGSVSAGLALAGCGGGSVPAEAVVRAWSDAVNTGENERAAKLFAKGAIAIQGEREDVLRTVDEAVAWNEELQCGGLVRRITTHADIVTATYELRDRGDVRCAARGGTATYEYEVRGNRIVFLRLLSATPAPPAPAAAATTADG